MLQAKKLTKRDSERGSILAVSAFGMLTFLLAVGLCVDISHFYVVKAELQNAADAAALAGSSALNSSPAGIDEATARAVQTMNGYEFNNEEVTINPDNVTFAVNFGGPYVDAATAKTQAADIRFVHVSIPPKSVGVFFATPVLDSDTVNLSQEAIAGMSVSPNVFCEWIPLAVIDDEKDPMIPGRTYIIRGGPQSSVSPGNRQILSFGGSGASVVRINLGKGINQCAEPGEEYTVDTKPGVDAGPVRDGLNTRFDEYSAGMDPAEFPPDKNVKEDITFKEYRDATKGSTNWKSPDPDHEPGENRRVVLIPMVKLSEFDPGRDTVKFYKFAAFFLVNKVKGGSGGDITAEYIEERIIFGKGGYKPGGGPVNPQLAMPVLYK